MWLDPKRYEIIDDEMAEVLRRKTPAERLEMAHSMWRMARELIRSRLRHDHPDWTSEQVNRETARRLAGGTS